jgi:transketolase
MKREFFDYLDRMMSLDPSIYFLMAGLGYPRTQEFIDKFPNRAFNTEASEQATLDMAVGLSYAGKVPFVYTITPFYYRAFETIRTYINQENLNVNLVGAGRDDDYSKHDGYSHDATDIKEILTTQSNIEQLYPESVGAMQSMLAQMAVIERPCFISIPR